MRAHGKYQPADLLSFCGDCDTVHCQKAWSRGPKTVIRRLVCFSGTSFTNRRNQTPPSLS